MQSSRFILQELNNNNTDTNDTKADELSSSSSSATLLPLSSTGSNQPDFPIIVPYNNTMTGPEGDVYLLSSINQDPVDDLIRSLEPFNVTQGGNCTQPTDVLYSTAFCPDFNATAQHEINLQACNGTAVISTTMYFILNNATELCEAIQRHSNDNEERRLAIASTLLGILALVVLTLTVLSRQKVKTLKEQYDDNGEDAGGEHEYQPVQQRPRM
jgi:hypothetical protein